MAERDIDSSSESDSPSTIASGGIKLQVLGVYRRVRLGHGNSKQPKSELWRLLCVDSAHDELIFKVISEKWDPVEKNAFAMARAEALGLINQKLLVPEPDTVRPAFMGWDDSKLLSSSPKALVLERNKKLGLAERLSTLMAWLAERDKNFDKIRELIELPQGEVATADDATAEPAQVRNERALERLLVLAFSPRHCSRTVAAHAKSTGCSQLSIKRLLHRYAWFGMGRNTLLKLDASKGACGPLVRQHTRKSGPRDAAEIVGGPSYAIRPRNDDDLPKFLYALQRYWADQHLSLKAAYNLMKKTLYVGYNQGGQFQTSARKIPTLRMFHHAAKTLIPLHEILARRLGHKDAFDIAAQAGYDTDIAPHIGTVFDLDGTPFNRQLVGRWRVNDAQYNIGKPYVVLVFERGSKKCVGWHVYIGEENWQEGYRLALLCAITSKRERLRWLKIDAPDAWPEGLDIRPGAIYVDGGPGASKKGREALKRLNIDFFLAPPDTPYWKPGVEGGIGIMQAKQAQKSGGYARTKDAVERNAKRLAKLHARATIWEFERNLVLDIIDYNGSFKDSARLTDEMKQDGVFQTSNDIYRWGVLRMGGVDHRRMLDAEAYEQLLEHKTVELTVNGVRALSSRYNSARMQRHASLTGTSKIDIFFDPLRPDFIRWRTPEGDVEKVRRDNQSRRENGLASAYDMEGHRLYMLAKNQMDGRRPKKKNLLTRNQGDILLETIGAGRKPARKVATSDESLLRALEARHQLSRTYDQDESFSDAAAGLPPETEVPSTELPESGAASSAPESVQRPAPASNVVPLKRSRSAAIYEQLKKDAKTEDDTGG